MVTVEVVQVVQCAHCGQKNRVPAVADGVPSCGTCHRPLPWVVDADDSTFEQVTSNSIAVVVDLWAPWCGPCRMVTPVLERLAGEFAGRLKLVKVNVDESPKVAARFDVRAVPTLLVMYRGEVLARQPGAAGPDVLRRWVEAALARAPAN